jgi:hypothetical protein|tara:strand:- start:1036 stop:1275 length:240 start_codon:yes stop_codon:yes gene_type:complete
MGITVISENMFDIMERDFNYDGAYLREPEMTEPLKKFLKDNYPGCKSVYYLDTKVGEIPHKFIVYTKKKYLKLFNSVIY